MNRGMHSYIRLPRAWSNLTLKVSREGASTTSLSNLFQCLTTLTVKDFFLISNLYLPSLSLKPFPLVLLPHTLLKSLSPSFFWPPLYILKGHFPVTSEPSLFHTAQPQLSQPVLTGEVFHPLVYFCDPSLDAIQQIHVTPVLRTPYLDTVHQARPHQCRLERQDHLFCPAGHASLDTAQDMTGFAGCEGTLLAHVQLPIHQYP